MIKIPIGIDADGNTVYVNFIKLDPRFGTLTNKKLAIQIKFIKEARKELAKQKGATVFLIILKVHFEPFSFSKK